MAALDVEKATPAVMVEMQKAVLAAAVVVVNRTKYPMSASRKAFATGALLNLV